MSTQRDAGQCRFCGTPLVHTFVDLGLSPMANRYPEPAEAAAIPFYPLHAFVCHECFLVQLAEFEGPESIFSDYAYFSSFSDSWLDHARRYTEAMAERFALNASSLVVEVASNDGYLLQYFRDRAIPILGIEPAQNVALVAEKAGIPTLAEFFGRELAEKLAAEGRQADLMTANNVLAHVPDLNDFVAGFRALLKPTGVATFEFPHLLQLIRHGEFDTIYHEHFSYFSLLTAERVFARHGLTVFDVETLPTHGGSLRLFVRHQKNAALPVTGRVEALKQQEREAGLDQLAAYTGFSDRVAAIKAQILDFLHAAKARGQQVVGYGAPAKGNTFLNFCGIGVDLVAYTVDRSPHKQGRLLPGSNIPIFAPEKIAETRPDFVLILPWNLRDEIAVQVSFIREWGGQCVVAIPETQVLTPPPASPVPNRTEVRI